MKKIMIFVVGLIAMLSMNVRAEDTTEEATEVKEPKELSQARATYQNAMKAVGDPVKKKYITQLEQMKKTLGGKGDIEGATAVDNEIKSLSGKAEDADLPEPIPGENMENITTKSKWDKIAGKIYTVDGVKGCIIKEKKYIGKTIMIIPNPTDMWRTDHNQNIPMVNYEGYPKRKDGTLTEGQQLSLVVSYNNDQKFYNVKAKPILIKSDTISLQPNDTIPGDNEGEIRVKVIIKKE